MKRSRLESLLHDYVAGDLDAPMRREIERRIDQEPETRLLFDEVFDAHAALQTLKERRAPDVNLASIQAAIATTSFEIKPKLYLRSEGTRFYRRLAAAALVLCAVTVGLFAVNRMKEPGPAKTTIPTAVERGLRPIEAGQNPNGMSADEFLRLLEQVEDPRELRVAPMSNAVPVSSIAVAER